MLYLADTPQKVDKIHRAICFAYSCISSIQFKSEVQLLRIRIAVNAIFLAHFSQAASFPIKYTIESIVAHILRGIGANHKSSETAKYF